MLLNVCEVVRELRAVSSASCRPPSSRKPASATRSDARARPYTPPPPPSSFHVPLPLLPVSAAPSIYSPRPTIISLERSRLICEQLRPLTNGVAALQKIHFVQADGFDIAGLITLRESDPPHPPTHPALPPCAAPLLLSR